MGIGMTFIANTTGVVSSANSTTTALNDTQTFTGTAEDVSKYPSATVACKTDQSGLLYMEFSPDGTNWDSSLSFTVEAGVNEFHRLSITRKYFRCRLYNNSGSNQTYLRLQTMFGYQTPVTSPLNGAVASDADSITTRSVLMGRNDGGYFEFVPVDSSGHLEVAVHGPLLPFGSVHTEKMTPIFQVDAVYGLNSTMTKETSDGTGAVTAANNMFKASTGTTIYSYAAMQTRRRLRYRPGQGLICRFTALFSSPAANSTLVAGVGTSESGYYFGYNGTAFGILHVTGGVREIQTLTVTTASTSTNNVQVTLNGTSYTVSGMTNNGSTTRTAYEISQGTFAGWTAEARGSTVVFLSNTPGNLAGSFTVAQSGAGVPVAGTFAETLAGVAATNTWYAQTAWDDPCDGTGASGFTLDKTKGNIFEIGMQYLGFGSVEFKIETYSGTNNPIWTTVHTLRFPNTLTQPHINQPSMPFTMAAYSAGSTTDVWVATGSFAGFIEGDINLIGPRLTYNDTSTAVSTGAYYALMTIRNGQTYKGRANQSVVNLYSFGGAHDDATPVQMFLLKDATLAGTINFTQWDTDSVTWVDTAATTATISRNSQIIAAVPVSQSGSILLELGGITLQPGESITLAATAVTGTSTYTIMTLNTREDQ